MKQWKKMFSLILALVLILSCVGNAFAAEWGRSVVKVGRNDSTVEARDSRAGSQIERRINTSKGFKSLEFQQANAYRYKDDQIVRAIVLLEGEPAAKMAKSRMSVASYGLRLEAQHKKVLKSLAAVDYDLKHEFTTLVNGMSMDVAYGDLDKIAAMPGVESVHIANYYAAPNPLPPTDGSSEMTGIVDMWNGGYEGEGQIIAVLDTGLNTIHEAFQNTDMVGEGALTEAKVAEVMDHGVYLSEKVPFAYDYGDEDNDVTDIRGHGTHVSGIATGYVEEADGAVTFTGAAPAAQLLAMKIFEDGVEGTSSDIYFAALEDAYLLGADVINMSIGSQNGFTYDESLEGEFQNIYKTLEDAGVMLCVAAGNETSMAANGSTFAGPGYVTADYADYGVVGTPSTYVDNNSVASVESLRYTTYTFQVDGQGFQFSDSSADGVADGLWLQTFSGKTMDYEMVPGTGTEADFAQVDVNGKIAVVARGGITFEEKADRAYSNGAIGVIVTNNEPGPLNMRMQIETFEVPAILTTLEAGQAMAAAQVKQVTVPDGQQIVENEQAWKISEFSNWGTTPDLTFKPTITSVGGNVYSAVHGGEQSYDVYSGTSMATPNLAGNMATLLEALEEAGVSDKFERMNLAKDLMESSALILNDENQLPYSPRRQGAGLGQVNAALAAYENGAYIREPLVELYDNSTGVYTFDVTLVNPQDTELTYTVDSVVLRDVVEELDDNIYNTLTSQILEGAEVDCTETVVVPAKGEKTVTVTVTLSAEAKAQMEADFVNGGFVEGFVTFENEKDQIHVSFMGFYGDWTKAPVMEEYDFRDVAPAVAWLATNSPDGENSYLDLGVSYTALMEMNTDANLAYVFGSWSQQAYAYAGDNMLGFEDYSEKHICLSTDRWAYGDSLLMNPTQLRNAEHLVMTVSDKETGEIYYVDDAAYMPKAMYNTQEGYWQSYSWFTWTGTDQEGNPLPNGTVATINFDAKLPYKDAEQKNVWSFDVTVDSESPVIGDIVYNDEDKTLTVTASDAYYLQGIYLSDNNGDIVDVKTYSSETKGDSFTAIFDVSKLTGSVVNVGAMDYATNETVEYNIYLGVAGLPATITYITPNETVEVECLTGDYYTIDGPNRDYSNNLFECWVDKTYTEAAADEIEQAFYEDDAIIVDGDLTLYALYAVCSEGEYDPTAYLYMEKDPGDWTGEYAICGFPLTGPDDTFFGNILEDPYVLNEEAKTLHGVDTQDFLVDPDYNLVFGTNDPGVRWIFEDEGGVCTIRNYKTGKYLTGDPESLELTMTDEVTDHSKWVVNIGDYEDCHISLAGYSNILLLMVDSTELDRTLELKLFDNNEEILVTYGGCFPDFFPDPVPILPGDYYKVWVYECLTTDLFVDYYTTLGAMEQVVLNIYQDGNTEKPVSKVSLQMPKGAKLNPNELYALSGLDEIYDEAMGDKFAGWFNDGGWNHYKSTGSADWTVDFDKFTVNGWTNLYCMVNKAKLENVIVKAVTDGDKANAQVIWQGKAPKGANLVEFLNKNAVVEDREGYTVDQWYNWDWYGHKLSDKATVNGWTNVYVSYTTVKMENVVVKAVVDGDKAGAKVVWQGKAPKGVNLVDFLNKNAKIDVPEGYTMDQWYNWDWYGHKYNDSKTVSGWTNVYVTFTTAE